MVVVTHQAEKIWTYDHMTVRLYDCTTVRPYDCMTVQLYDHMTVRPHNCTTVRPTIQGATYNMHGQLYYAGTPTPWLCPVVQWSVHWAPSWTTQVLVLAGARHCALGMCRKKNVSSAFRLG